MQGITYKKENGMVGLQDGHNPMAALIKLYAYEQTGLTPEQITEMDKLYQEKCNEVAALKRQMEQYGPYGKIV